MISLNISVCLQTCEHVKSLIISFQVFMKHSVKRFSEWKLRTWNLDCSPTKFQRRKRYYLQRLILCTVSIFTINKCLKASINMRFSSQVCYLMPSSSPRCAQFPRAQDKVHFYIKLKELRDQLKGVVQNREIQETEYTFDLVLAKGKLGPLNIIWELIWSSHP